MSPVLPAVQQEQRKAQPPEALPDADNEITISDGALRWCTGILLAYFAARLLFLACAVAPFAPPDEVTHAGICRIFSQVLGLPDNSPQSYQFGAVTNNPWLYYWIMGKLRYLNLFGIPDLTYLRLINIPLAFGTLYFTRRTLLLLTRNRLAEILLLAALTNTAMFTLLSASVSYDNLTNLLAAMSVYYMLAFFRRGSPDLLAWAILSQMAGTLTKMTILPLALVLDLLLLAYALRHLRALPGSTREYFRAPARRLLWPVLPLLVGLALNLQLYGGNCLHYGTLNPSMHEILPQQIAMQYRLEARGLIFNQYKEGKLSYMDALGLTGEISHPGDKADTFFLLMNWENLKRNPALWMGFPQYAPRWLESMLGTVFGIKTHLPMIKSGAELVPYYLLLALALLGTLLRWRPREPGGGLAACLAVSAGYYAGYLMYMVNYDNYLNYGAIGITLQGRYIFPVLCPIYVLSCHYLIRLFPARSARLALVAAAAVLFIAGDFPWFLAHAGPGWYAWFPR